MADGTVVEIALATIRLIRGAASVMPLSLNHPPSASALHTPPANDSLAGNIREQVAFHGGRPSRLVVGSDESATWRLSRPDVAPRQLEVVWDGAELWLQDPLRLGRTFVNGRTLNEWMPVAPQAVVCFGGVQMWMVSRAKPSGQQVPDFAALDRARLTDAHQSARLRLSDTSRFTVPAELLRALNERGAQ
ncbi:MAG: hypothetical protein JWN48_5209 [Myxococcaceae bacterium]|nr:hypothetical protein [Myxococcaceae bacterium]